MAADRATAKAPTHPLAGLTGAKVAMLPAMQAMAEVLWCQQAMDAPQAMEMAAPQAMEMAAPCHRSAHTASITHTNCTNRRPRQTMRH